MTVTPIAPRSTGLPIRPPVREPISGIMQVATVIEGVGLLSPDGMIESYNCMGIDVTEVDCDGFTGQSKRFDAPSFADGAMFVVQSGMTCKPFGFDGNDPQLRRAFDVKENEGVSIGLHDFVLDTATDVSPGSPVPPAVALGILEGVGLTEYSGEPIIHLGPGTLAQLTVNGAIAKVGNRLETHLGTPVVPNLGVETKTGGVLDPSQWAFVTGAVVVARSEVFQGTQIDRNTNDVTVLFERLYAVGVDCLAAKVKVKVY